MILMTDKRSAKRTLQLSDLLVLSAVVFFMGGTAYGGWLTPFLDEGASRLGRQGDELKKVDDVPRGLKSTEDSGGSWDSQTSRGENQSNPELDLEDDFAPSTHGPDGDDDFVYASGEGNGGRGNGSSDSGSGSGDGGSSGGEPPSKGGGGKDGGGGEEPPDGPDGPDGETPGGGTGDQNEFDWGEAREKGVDADMPDSVRKAFDEDKEATQQKEIDDAIGGSENVDDLRDEFRSRGEDHQAVPDEDSFPADIHDIDSGDRLVPNDDGGLKKAVTDDEVDAGEKRFQESFSDDVGDGAEDFVDEPADSPKSGVADSGDDGNVVPFPEDSTQQGDSGADVIDFEKFRKKSDDEPDGDGDGGGDDGGGTPPAAQFIPEQSIYQMALFA